MPILLIVIRLLLMLFGGGCTLFYGGIFISDPSAILDDIGSNLPSFLLIGLAPLVGGIFLVSWIADGAPSGGYVGWEIIAVFSLPPLMIGLFVWWLAMRRKTG